jgi:hypothetical protein
MGLIDEVLAVAYFLVTLGTPWYLPFLGVGLLGFGGKVSLGCFGFAAAVLTALPMPKYSLIARSSRLSLALIRYFSFEILVDRNDPLQAALCTIEADSKSFQEKLIPSMFLACPHGVFNYGAIAWCCISRWCCGWYQYTGGASIVHNIPGLRYMDMLIWMISADKKSIKRALQERGNVTDVGERRRGGMIGMVPDGIHGAFHSTPGVDELLIGSKRGLMRICLEEGAAVWACWFYGTNDMMKILKDPLGLMEAFSRKMQAGIIGYYGRWLLPVPHRVAVTASVSVTTTTKVADPSTEEVEELHRKVYGGLEAVYEQQKHFAGYPNRKLVVK